MIPTIFQFLLLVAVTADAKEFRVAPRELNFLNQFRLPRVDLEDRSIEVWRDFTWSRSIELDVSELDPVKKGVMILIPQDLVPPVEHEGGITYSAKNVSISTLLKALAKEARLDLYNTSVGVVFCPPGRAPFPNRLTKEGKITDILYKVEPRPNSEKNAGEHGEDADAE